MFNFFKKRDAITKPLSPVDRKLVQIINEIRASAINKHWMCPECNVELKIVFKGEDDKTTGEKWLAMFVSCHKCGFQSVTDGTGDIPKWWTDENRKPIAEN